MADKPIVQVIIQYLDVGESAGAMNRVAAHEDRIKPLVTKLRQQGVELLVIPIRPGSNTRTEVIHIPSDQYEEVEVEPEYSEDESDYLCYKEDYMPIIEDESQDNETDSKHRKVGEVIQESIDNSSIDLDSLNSIPGFSVVHI